MGKGRTNSPQRDAFDGVADDLTWLARGVRQRDQAMLNALLADAMGTGTRYTWRPRPDHGSRCWSVSVSPSSGRSSMPTSSRTGRSRGGAGGGSLDLPDVPAAITLDQIDVVVPLDAVDHIDVLLLEIRALSNVIALLGTALFALDSVLPRAFTISVNVAAPSVLAGLSNSEL